MKTYKVEGQVVVSADGGYMGLFSTVSLLNDKVTDLEVAKGLLRAVEDDLYHICLFNPEVKSKTLIDVQKYLNSSEHTVECEK